MDYSAKKKWILNPNTRRVATNLFVYISSISANQKLVQPSTLAHCSKRFLNIAILLAASFD